MKKKLIIMFVSLFLILSSGALKIQAMNMKAQKLEISKMGKSKKAQFKSKHKHYIAVMNLVPKTMGMAKFKSKIFHKNKEPLSKKAKIKISYEMPGMKMDLPKVILNRINLETFEIDSKIVMNGYWKFHLDIEDKGIKDRLTIKIITK